jgi:hypothetical protein
MDARERVMAVLSGEEPDRVPILGSDTVRLGSPGGWVRRLAQRGMGLIRRICPYRPYFNFPSSLNLFVPTIHWNQEQYIEDGKIKMRFTLVTPVGQVTSIISVKFTGTLGSFVREEYFIKERSDWKIFTYLFNIMTKVMAPNYEEFEREEDTLGGQGITLGYLTKTSFPRAWIQLASCEQAIIDFMEMPEEVCEFLEAEQAFHRKAAEIAAGSPAKVLNFYDNLTDMVSPKFFETFCVPTYHLYAEATRGTDKVLACHMDGKLSHLKESIARSPIQLIDSLTVPPVGNVTIKEIKTIWQDKIIFINCPPHLTHVSPEEVRLGYLQLLEEWGDKRLAIEYIEDIPSEELEPHLNAALDACGYAP